MIGPPKLPVRSKPKMATAGFPRPMVRSWSSGRRSSSTAPVIEGLELAGELVAARPRDDVDVGAGGDPDLGRHPAGHDLDFLIHVEVDVDPALGIVGVVA